MKTLITFLLTLCINTSFCQNKHFLIEETIADSVSARLDSIKLIGSGSAMTRIFLDELSKELVEKFRTKKITVEYIDAGKNLKDFDKQYLDMKHDSNYAVLLFLPTDKPDFATYYKHNNFHFPTNYGYIRLGSPKQKMAYHQSFYLNLYVYPKAQLPRWQAFLAVMSEISKDRLYNTLSKKIVSLLKDKGYVL